MSHFPLILLLITATTGVVWLLDKFIKPVHEITIFDFMKSLFPVLLIVFLIRAFLFSPYVVPSGSLEPTVVPGDFLLVSKFSYGLRLPVWHTTIMQFENPKRGDIVVFHWPVNPNVYLIKRVIGLPGDRISYINRVLTINGKKMPQTFIADSLYGDANDTKWSVMKMQENLGGTKHFIYLCKSDDMTCPGHTSLNFHNLVVPKGEYFMMGDNRDDSDDSRYWGFVPETDLVGKADFIWLSWNSKADWLHKIRWHRIGKRV